MRTNWLATVVTGAAVAIVTVHVSEATGRAQSGDTARPPQPAVQSRANVNQLMRGIFFTNANVVFASQLTDPASVPLDSRPAIAPNPLASVFGGWEAVGNSGLALVEAATLLEAPRPCANGKMPSIEDPVWKKAVADLKAAGFAVFAVAQARNLDQILDVSEQLSDACALCHRKFRAAGAARCG